MSELRFMLLALLLLGLFSGLILPRLVRFIRERLESRARVRRAFKTYRRNRGDH